MDYDKTLVNLNLLEGDVIKDFASLDKDFAQWVDRRGDGLIVPAINIIRFIVSCYDKESYIAHQYKGRWTQRKKQAAEFAGLLSMDRKFKESVEKIMYAQSPVINKIIIKYLSLLYDRDFMSYAIKSEILTKQSEQLLNFQFDKPSEMAKAMENVESIQQDLEDLEKKIFSGGDVITLKNVLFEEANKFMLSELRPENIVSKLEKGEPVVDINPYGEGYEIPKMRFIDDQ